MKHAPRALVSPASHFHNPVYNPAMMPMARGLACSIAVLLSGAGCGSNPPVESQIVQQVSLSDSPLALLRDVVLLRAGDGFVLAGLDGHQVRWGQLSSTGDLTGETVFDLPEQPATTPGGQVLGPQFAVTSKTVPGDQLVVVVGVLQAGTTDQYEVHAAFYDLGSQVPTVVQIVGVQAATANSGAIRLLAGSAPNGTRALVMWGVEGQLAPIHYQMFGADGALIGAEGKLNDAPDPNKIPLWTCLDTTQNAPSLAVTWVESVNANHPQQPAWRRIEMNDDGTTGPQALIYMNDDVSDCRIVSTLTAGQYLLAWQNNATKGGTFFASLQPPAPDAGSGTVDDVNMRTLLASASYGGYAQMPKLTWIAPAGYDIIIGLARTDGPQVARFDTYADPEGKNLYLPSVSGNTGPVSAWVGTDAVYATYLDIPGPSARSDAGLGGNSRFFVTVQGLAESHQQM